MERELIFTLKFSLQSWFDWAAKTAAAISASLQLWLKGSPAAQDGGQTGTIFIQSRPRGLFNYRAVTSNSNSGIFVKGALEIIWDVKNSVVRREESKTCWIKRQHREEGEICDDAVEKLHCII